jgi:hypothetical protein
MFLAEAAEYADEAAEKQSRNPHFRTTHLELQTLNPET